MQTKKLRIGINGFGRIGRLATRIIVDRPNLDLVAINSRASASSHAYLLKYDSTYGTFSHNVSDREDSLVVDDHRIVVIAKDKPKDIPWKNLRAQIVIDSTGIFRTSDQLSEHLAAGASRVVLSAPAKDSTKTLVMGVNHESYDPQIDKIVSNSSCTTNCLATMVKVLHKAYGIKRGFATTTHAVTDSQNLLDNSHKKEARLRRSAFQSIIPASTGSAIDIGKLFPDLKKNIICQSVRVPLPVVSMLSLTVELKKPTTKDKINALYLASSKNGLKGIVSVSEDELVSRDYVGDPHSAIIDTYLTGVSEETMVNVYAWYDNEWGYAQRLVDLVEYIGDRSKL